MGMNQFRNKFLLVFGVIFIYMVMGVFFKHQVGIWFSAIWYLMGLLGIAYIIYIKYQKSKPKNKTKIVNAEIVKR